MFRTALRRSASRSLALAALLVASLVGLGSSPAAASEVCLKSFSYNGERIAQLCEVWTNGETPALYLRSRGSHSGKSKKMYLRVCRYAGGVASDYTCKSDSGSFQYYAGPVRHHMCRKFTVKIYKPGDATKILVNKAWTEVCN